MQIAIDGPAGAGKSSIAKSLAKELGILYLDTGAMYRAVGYKAMKLGIDTLNEEKVSAMMDDIEIKVIYSETGQHIILDGTDITEHIREPEVSINASNASKHRKVRDKLVAMQQEIAKETDVVAEGRDIGTYVLPEAEYKFYITASAEERAKRRHKELCEKGKNTDIEKLAEEIKARDYQDMNREYAPLKAAEDSVLIDTTNLNFDEVLSLILDTIKDKGKRNESN
ncbi:MAG: (d)CMP kinase [Clostridia bacterium]|nr:(d)CMP kinase [Clostridia bacterium]